MAEPARCGPGRSAGDGAAMAPSGVSDLLALEVAEAGRAAEDRPGTAGSDSADERGKSALGRVSHPRRAVDAGL